MVSTTDFIVLEQRSTFSFVFQKATTHCQVTLLFRIFGRGLDFKVNHLSFESADGECVICTFFPDSASDEIQMKGRAPRQGKRRTFEFILWQSDVQRDFSIPPELLKDSPYELLVKQRTIQSDQLSEAKKEQVHSLLETMCILE